MRAELAALSRILAVVNRAALWIAGIGLVLMTVFVAWQVFGRYVLNQSPSWTEPASLLLMSWFILLGSAVGVRDGNHLGFEIALHYAPHGLRQIMLGVTEILVIDLRRGHVLVRHVAGRRDLVGADAGSADPARVRLCPSRRGRSF